MRKLTILFFLSLASIAVHAEKFSYHVKSVTNIQNGIDMKTQSKSMIIVVDTDNSTVSIDGKQYEIVSSAWGKYPETYFYVKGSGNHKSQLLILIDYKYNHIILDSRNGIAEKYNFYKSSIN